MAIDTATKRASALNTFLGALPPLPDSTIDQGDRQTLLRCYSGILADTTATVINTLRKLAIDIGISL